MWRRGGFKGRRGEGKQKKKEKENILKAFRAKRNHLQRNKNQN